MKLKYYLRGIGIGVIVATLIMTVSSAIHNNNLSKEVIIKEALKLGMVMPDSTEGNDSLWSTEEDVLSDSANTEDASNTELQSTEDSQTTEGNTVGVITVEDGDAARHVSEKLKAAGLIEDAEEFRLYLSNSGYASYIKNGTFEIPKGSTYEEICDYIINR